MLALAIASSTEVAESRDFNILGKFLNLLIFAPFSLFFFIVECC